MKQKKAIPLASIELYIIFAILLYGVTIHAQYTNDVNALHLYTWGTYSMLENNNALSEKIFETLRTHYNLEPHMYDSYMHYLFKANRYHDIVALEPLITSKLSSCLPIQQLYLQALEITGNQEKADGHVAKLYAQYPDSPEIAYAYALILIRSKKTTQAMKIVYRSIQHGTHNNYAFLFHFLAAQLYAGANQLKQAQEEIHTVQKLNPLFEQGWLFGAAIAELQGNITHAIENYMQFIELTGEDQGVRNQIALLTQQAIAQNSANTHFEQALVLYKNKNYVYALREIELHTQQNPLHTSGQILKIEILWASRQYAHAYGQLYEHIAKDPHNSTWLKVAFLFYKANIHKQHLLHMLKSLEQAKEPSLLTAYLADIYIKEKDYNNATHLLDKLVHAHSLPDIKPKALYQLISLYFSRHEYDKIPALIEYGLALHISFSPFLNSAAYFYATKTNQLARAQKLIHQALAQEPHNIYYLDTQAFIWYKQKNYRQAEQLLTQISRKASNNFFIAKHLAKTLQKQNKVLEFNRIAHGALTMHAPQYEKAKLEKMIMLFNK